MEDKIVLYTIGCPKCRVLEKKLEDAGVKYTKVEDIHLMMAKGMMSTPMLEANGDIMDFAEAINWVNEVVK